MNNNRNTNNRRRGRGNRNQGGNGQGNRIDSRARGNAPQLLDKYKKLAQDAQHNGDRVQAEYYLQFADHYFRVIADNRVRQDEHRGDQRGGRRDERDQDDFDTDDEDDGDDRRRFEPRERDSRPERPRRERPRDDRFDEGDTDQPGRNRSDVAAASEGPSFEPGDNPFTRDAREERPRQRTPRPRRESKRGGEAEVGFDAAVLPPSFSANDAGDAPARDDEPAEAAPRRRRKRSDDGTLSAAG